MVAKRRPPTIASQVKLDFNRIDWPTFLEFIRRNDELTEKERTEGGSIELALAKRQVSGELLEKVLVSWPFDAPMTAEGYMSLGLIDAKAVDEVLAQGITKLNPKN